MESIRAVVVDPDTEKRLTLQNVDPPSPLSNVNVAFVPESEGGIFSLCGPIGF